MARIVFSPPKKDESKSLKVKYALRRELILKTLAICSVVELFIILYLLGR